MNLVFNELSATDLAPNQFTARSRISALIQETDLLFENGFTRLTVSDRFFETELAENYTVSDWFADPAANSIEKTLLPGIIRNPYIELSDEPAYINNNIYLDEPTHPKHGTHGEGLATCWIRNELSFSLNSHAVWCSTSIGLDILPHGGALIKNRVPNICAFSHFTNRFIQDWLKLKTSIKLTNATDVTTKYPSPAYQFAGQALEDIEHWIVQNRIDYVEKIEEYLDEITKTPFNGRGKPEPLKGNFSGWWSRRISDGDRFIYRIENGIIHIYSAKGHYEN